MSATTANQGPQLIPGRYFPIRGPLAQVVTESLQLGYVIIATVSISHPTTHSTVSQDDILWEDGKAGSLGDVVRKRRKWSDARNADARRQHRPSDHYCSSTKTPSYT